MTETEMHAENARLRAELEQVKAQRASAHRKAKFYRGKWKHLSREVDQAPTVLMALQHHLTREIQEEERFHLTRSQEEAWQHDVVLTRLRSLETVISKLLAAKETK